MAHALRGIRVGVLLVVFIHVRLRQIPQHVTKTYHRNELLWILDVSQHHAVQVFVRNLAKKLSDRAVNWHGHAAFDVIRSLV